MQVIRDIPEIKLQAGLTYKDRSGRVVQITQQKQNCCCTFYEGGSADCRFAVLLDL